MSTDDMSTDEKRVRDEAALYRLMSWLSPAYPVGAFSYSQGLETAVARAIVREVASTREWIAASLSGGTMWSDAVLFARGFDFAGSDENICRINAFAMAFQPSSELRAETLGQGRAFAEVTTSAWPCAELRMAVAAAEEGLVYPLAVACAAAGHGIGREAALLAWLHAGVSNIVSAAIRLVPLGHSEGQRCIAGLETHVAATARRAAVTPLDELSTFALVAEISSMAHETQETRLFRS
jgi:urease accessory protein